MTRHVYEARLLCGRGHAMVSAAAECPDTQHGQAMFAAYIWERSKAEIASGRCRRKCALCGSPIKDWRVEVERTPYVTMDTAREAHLRKVQRTEGEMQMLENPMNPTIH